MPVHNTKTPEEIAQWAAYLDDGYAVKHIGEIFNVHVQTIRKYLPGRAWSKKQVTDHMTTVRKGNEAIRRVRLR